MGPFQKKISDQLKAYIDLYREAHLLIHPAVFEAAGIVPSEAAAFGTPTITNDTGGLATTVDNGVSGIVLPKGSPAMAYADAISYLARNPRRYYTLCNSTRKRYESELNWNSAGKQVASVIEQVVQEI